MQPTIYLLISMIFLIGTAFLTALNGAFRRLHLSDPGLEYLNRHFFYRPFHRYFFPVYEYEGLLCAIFSAQNITRFSYALFSLMFLLSTGLLDVSDTQHFSFYGFGMLWGALSIIAMIFAGFVFGEYLPRILGARAPNRVLKYSAAVSSFFMCLAFPVTYLTLRLSNTYFHSVSFEEPLTQTKRDILEIIERSRVTPEINTHEKKLIEYVLRFKDRIAREVMVPRVEVFSLSADTSIKEAAKLVKEEGFSRIPIYKNTVDNIVGVLMYKDVLNEYMRYESQKNDPSVLEAPIENIQKNVLYTPETKKISNLLLEFRKQQVHLAIVVDEYGGTEGIVTIEDILEEIVGEIEDEYDEEEESFFPRPDGSWIVDARMGILEVEQQLGILIPQEGDYDTVGGYIFHCAGSIPPKGYVIHQEEFEMEILLSDERRVERVRIKPVTQKEAIEEEKEEENPSAKDSHEHEGKT